MNRSQIETGISDTVPSERNLTLEKMQAANRLRRDQYYQTKCTERSIKERVDDPESNLTVR